MVGVRGNANSFYPVYPTFTVAAANAAIFGTSANRILLQSTINVYPRRDLLVACITVAFDLNPLFVGLHTPSWAIVRYESSGPFFLGYFSFTQILCVRLRLFWPKIQPLRNFAGYSAVVTAINGADDACHIVVTSHRNYISAMHADAARCARSAFVSDSVPPILSESVCNQTK